MELESGYQRIQKKIRRERAEDEKLEAVKVFDFLVVQSKVTDAYRLGEYKEGRDGVLFVKLVNTCDRGIILLLLYKQRDYDKPVYLSKELAPHEWQIENQLVKARKNLLENGE